jgi:hypothetical protein
MGSGFRTFQSGEVLTAANVQNYLMDQSVMVFAGTAALGSAIGTAVEAGMVAYLTDADQLIHYQADSVQGTAWVGIPMDSSDRNVVINGAMQVAQRGTSTASITASGYYTVDRWSVLLQTLGTHTMSVENDAPTGSGFRKSLKMLCTTADASPASTDYFIVRQILEGQNVQQFLKGTSSAKQFSLSFWVKSNVTGTYICQLFDKDNTRTVSASYTVSASATWEKKTITFPADTTGAFTNDNGDSLEVRWWLAGGSSFTSGTLQTTWASLVDANAAVGQTNLAAATNNYWQITGVQLEAGAVATPFEFEDYGVTLAKCERYFQRIINGADQTNEIVATIQATGAGAGYGFKAFLGTMRTSPSVTSSAAGGYLAKSAGGNNLTLTSLTFDVASPRGMNMVIAVSSGLVAGDACLVLANSATATMDASAEL